MKRSHVLWLTCLFAALAPAGCRGCKVEPLLENPYKNYAFWYKGNTHTHTNVSTGSGEGDNLPTQEVVNLYALKGYDFLALTDHNTMNCEPVKGLCILRGRKNGNLWGGCESGDWWENHLSAIGVTSCPEECANCFWSFLGGARPKCSTAENQWRIDQALDEDGLVILNHPSARGDICWPGEEIEMGWRVDKMEALQGYHAVEINDSMDEWEYVLSLGRKVWGVAADDFHSGTPGRGGWIVVNSNSSPINATDIIENIKNGNFYSVVNTSGQDAVTLQYKSIQVLVGVVAVSFQGARTLRFIDCTGVLDEVTFSGDENVERSASYIPDNSAKHPMPTGYLRIEIEDDNGNIAYSQPLRVIGAASCRPDNPPTCSKTSCADLPCCPGHHCCGDRCYPDEMSCP